MVQLAKLTTEDCSSFKYNNVNEIFIGDRVRKRISVASKLQKLKNGWNLVMFFRSDNGLFNLVLELAYQAPTPYSQSVVEVSQLVYAHFGLQNCACVLCKCLGIEEEVMSITCSFISNMDLLNSEKSQFTYCQQETYFYIRETYFFRTIVILIQTIVTNMV